MTTHPTSTPGAATASTGRAADMEDRLAKLAEAGPDAINDRLTELDREWGVGRLTKVTAGAVVLGGLALVVAAGPWFAIVPALGALVMLQYVFTNRSLLGGLFTAMGFRSGCLIEREKTALKVLRGDFRTIPTVHDIEDPDAIARLEGEGGIVVEPDTAKVAPKAAVKEVVEATALT